MILKALNSTYISNHQDVTIVTKLGEKQTGECDCGCCALLAKSSLSLFSPFGGSLKRDCSPLLLYHRISFCLFAKKRFLAFVYPRVVILTTLLRSLIRYRNGIFGQTLIPLQTSLLPSSKCIFKQT